MKRIMIGVLLLGLCGCAGSTPVAASGSTAGTVAPTRKAGSAGTTVDGAPAASIPQQLCGFLAKEAPRLRSRGSRPAAVATFSVDFARYVRTNPNRSITDSTELDQISTRTCPKVRAQVLTSMDGTSFAQVLPSR